MTAGARTMAALLAAAFGLSACRDDGGPGAVSGPPAVQRLALSLAPGAGPAPQASVLQAFDPAAEGAGIAVDAPHFGVVVPEWLPPGSPALLTAGAGQRERAVRVTLRSPWTLDGARRLVVAAAVEGTGGASLVAEFRRGGASVFVSEPQRFREQRSLDLLEFALPPGLGTEPCDALVLACTGGRRVLALGQVQLMAEAPGADLPRPEQGPALVRLGTEARPALGLLPGRALVAECVVPEASQLVLAWCEPDGGLDALPARHVASDLGGAPPDVPALPAIPGLTLTYELSDAPEGVLELTYPTGPGWRRAVVDLLPAWVGQRLRLTFRVADDASARALALAPPEVRRNAVAERTVLLITSDTHRADHLGAQPGAVPIATPVLDALAARGTLFADCYAPVNNTNPSHVALMTGMHPRDTGVLDNYRPVAEAAQTLAEAFAEAGFLTYAAVSTLHLGPPGSGLGQGFDRVSWPGQGAHRDSRETIGDLLAWLPEARGQPLFLWLHVFDAHMPYEPPAEVAQRLWPADRDPRDPGLPPPPAAPDSLPRSLRDVRDLAWPVAMYRGEVEALDERLARLLTVPRIAEGVVALVADHGESLGENQVWFGHGGIAPATLHIPLVLAGPGVPAGRVVARPVTHLSLGATLLDLAGVTDAPLPGASLLAQLDTRGPEAPRFALEANGLAAAVTHGGLHLVLHLQARDVAALGPPRAQHAVELFDLASDPRAEHDLALARRDQARTLRANLIAWLTAARPTGWAHPADTAAEHLEAMAELGYVGPSSAAPDAPLFTPDDCAECAPYSASK